MISNCKKVEKVVTSDDLIDFFSLFKSLTFVINSIGGLTLEGAGWVFQEGVLLTRITRQFQISRRHSRYKEAMGSSNAAASYSIQQNAVGLFDWHFMELVEMFSAICKPTLETNIYGSLVF